MSLPQSPLASRPMVIEGVTYQTHTPVGQAFITINHNQDKEPFEMFITIGKSGSDISAMAEALGRMVSLNLRLTGRLSAKEKMRQVVAQLAGIGGARSVGFGKDKVRSLPDAVAKILAIHYGFALNGKVEDKKVESALGNGHPKGFNGNPDRELSQGTIEKSESSNGNGNGVSKNIVQNESMIAPEVVKMQQLALTGAGQGVFADAEGMASSSSTSLYDICPECGGGSLAYEEGCRKCYSCGYAEC